MMTKAQRKVLANYFYKRLESLHDCDAYFERTLEAEKQSFMDCVNRGDIQVDDPELQQAFTKVDYLILPTFRNCMVVAVCTFLEDILARICTTTISNFESQLSNLSKQRRSKISKYLYLIESCLQIDFEPIQSKLDLIHDTIKIRNAIVHAWGRIDYCRNPANIRNIISSVGWAEETADGYMLLNDDAYADAVIPVMEVVEYIFDEIPISEKTED